MPNRELVLRWSECVGQQGGRIAEFFSRYVDLLSILREEGSEVERRRVINTHPHPSLYPHGFVEEASHLFIFPRQVVELNTVVGKSKPIRVSFGVGGESKSSEHVAAEYDKAQVMGHMMVSYAMKDDAPKLQLVDRLSEVAPYELPAQSLTDIDQLFRQFDQVTANTLVETSLTSA